MDVYMCVPSLAADLIPMTGTLPSALNVSSSAFLPSGRISSVITMPRLGGGAQEAAGQGEADVEWLSPAYGAKVTGEKGWGETERMATGDALNAPSAPSLEVYQPQREEEFKSSLPRNLWRIKDLGLLLDT